MKTASLCVIATAHLRKKMGDYMFARYCRNLGIPFEDCYFFIFGKKPRSEQTMRHKK